MNTTHRQNLEAEELTLLNDSPKTITIERTERMPRGLWGRIISIFRGKGKTRLETLSIRPLTLGTILKISQEGQRLEQPRDLPQELEDKLPDLSYHWGAVEANAQRLARIVAIAVLSGRASDEEIEHLSGDILHSITSDQLATLCLGILSSADLVGFTNSIRLMRASRVTNPDLIEKED